MNTVTFGDLRSYEDLQLLLTGKTIGTPSPKVETVDIPGGDGVIDLTDAFGETKYKNRSLSFNFETIVPRSQFMNVFSSVQNKLHGKRMRIQLSEDPNYYYVGRISVHEWKADKRIGRFTVDCDCEPYKYKVNETVLLQQFSGKNLFNYINPQISTKYNTEITSLSTGIRVTSLSAGQWRFVQFAIAPIKALVGRTITCSYKAAATAGAAERVGLGYFKNPYNPLSIVAYSTANSNAVSLKVDEKQAEMYDSVGLWLYSSRDTDGQANAYVDYTNVQVEIGSTATAFTAYDSTAKTATITAANGRKTAVPTIITTAAATVTKDGFTASVLADTVNTIPELEMKEGNNVFTVSGSGLFVIRYQEGSL